MRFDHVAVQVPDIAAAVAWWRDTVPGTEVRYEDDTWALVEAGGGRVAFVLAEQHPQHVALRVDDAELEGLAARLGAEVRSHRDGSRSAYVDGPGGVVEMISYPAGD